MNYKSVKKTSIALICFLVLLFGLAFSSQVMAGIYDAGGEGADKLDLIGEYGFERQTSGPPDTTLMDVIVIIINAVLSFLGVIFLVLIIYGGYMWMFSGGSEEKITKAKKIITNSAIGVAIILASAAITQLVMNTINEEGLDASEWATSDRSVMDIIVSIINIALGLFGVLFTAMIIYSGYTWMFSGGNEEKVAKARKMLVSSVIGAVIILMSFAITRLISTTVAG